MKKERYFSPLIETTLFQPQLRYTTVFPGTFYHLFVLHRDIDKLLQKRLQDLVQKHGNAQLTFIDTSNILNDIAFTEEMFGTGDHMAKFTMETLYRCIPNF